MNDSNTPLLEEDDFEPGESKRFHKLISTYTTAIFLDNDFRGSGTFVSVSGRFGILTASHVVHEGKPMRLFDTGAKEVICLRLQNAPHRFEIPVAQIKEVSIGKPCCDYSEKGPDLTFLWILDNDCVQRILSLKSFWNFDHLTHGAHQVHIDGNCLITGFPGLRVNSEEWRGQPAKRTQEFHLSGTLDPKEHCMRNGFDYIRANIRFQEESQLPTDLGGMSGGSIWQYKISERAETKKLYFHNEIFVGVNFWQDELVGDHRRLRGHFYFSMAVASETIRHDVGDSA